MLWQPPWPGRIESSDPQARHGREWNRLASGDGGLIAAAQRLEGGACLARLAPRGRSRRPRQRSSQADGLRRLGRLPRGTRRDDDDRTHPRRVLRHGHRRSHEAGRSSCQQILPGLADEFVLVLDAATGRRDATTHNTPTWRRCRPAPKRQHVSQSRKTAPEGHCPRRPRRARAARGARGHRQLLPRLRAARPDLFGELSAADVRWARARWS